MSNDNKSAILNRSKTKEDSDKIKGEENVKKSINKKFEKDKEENTQCFI